MSTHQPLGSSNTAASLISADAETGDGVETATGDGVDAETGDAAVGLFVTVGEATGLLVTVGVTGVVPDWEPAPLMVTPEAA